MKFRVVIANLLVIVGLCSCSTSAKYQPIAVTNKSITTYAHGKEKKIGNGLLLEATLILDHAIPRQFRETGIFPVAVVFLNTSNALMYVGPSQFEASTDSGVSYSMDIRDAHARVLNKYKSEAELNGLLNGLLFGAFAGYGIGYATGKEFGLDHSAANTIGTSSAMTGGITGAASGLVAASALSYSNAQGLDSIVLPQTAVLPGGRVSGLLLFDSKVRKVSFRYGEETVMWTF